MLYDRWNRRDHDDGEPDYHHRPEEGRHARGAARLNRKQSQQNDHRDRHDIRIERRGDEFDALNG